MQIDLRFPRNVLLVLAGVVALSIWPLVRMGSGEVIVGSIAGAALSTVNVLLGYLAIEYSYDKSSTTFLKYVIGGMGIRLSFMLGTMVALILVVRVNAVALTVSMLGLYLIYLIMEILFIQKKVSLRNRE